MKSPSQTPLLVNNFQESIETKAIQDTTEKMQHLIDHDAMNTKFVNQLINKIEETLQTKEGLHGNTCIFTMRSLIYDNFVGYHVYTIDRDLELRDMLNECFSVHRELVHFEVVSVTTYDHQTLPIKPFSDECTLMCGLCICCPCWFPCYCVFVHIYRLQ